MTDDVRLTPAKRRARDAGIRQGLERAYHERLMGQLRKAHYDAKPEKGRLVFTVTFDRVKDEKRTNAALEAFRIEMAQRNRSDCSWERLSKGTYTVTVTKQ